GPITDIPGVVHYIRNYILRNRSGHDFHYEGLISKGVLPAQPAQWAIIDSGDSRDASAVFGGTSILQQSLNQESFGLILSPEKEWSGLAGIARARGIQHVFLLDTPEGRLSPEGQKDVLRKLVDQANPLGLTAGSRWADSMSWIAGLYPDREILRFTQLSEINRREGIWLHKAAFGGKLRRSLNLNTTRFNVLCISVAGSAEFPKVDPYQKFSATRIKPSGFPFTEKTFQDKPPDTTDTLETAETILDIGYGIRDQEGLKLVEKLKARLEELGLNIVLGATRKVTQDLKLLPVKHQIGQTGVRVKPKLILAFGISGAPQHMDYIDEQAVIFSFNKDPEAPLMTYNQHRPSPLVHPVSGDLFSNLTRLIREL
ncbi:MAG TPA: FAD-binding protein, partial [Nitrospiria bacterium]|nr:FAD-binding protein [Nitrospiria bacterium]